MTGPISRRSFTSAIAAAAFARPLAAQASALKARVKIDTERTIGDIDPNLYGNFAEHLGRCIYGGIYEPGSKLSDSDGYRTDVLQAAEAPQRDPTSISGRQLRLRLSLDGRHRSRRQAAGAARNGVGDHRIE